MFLSRNWLICRVCMQQRDDMTDLFTQIAGQPVWNLLRDCGGIPVRRNDNLPDKICDNCIERLWKAHAFRLDCQKAHRDIIQLVQPITTDDEFISDHDPEKSEVLDKFHTGVIEKFESQKQNDYPFASCDSIETLSTREDDTTVEMHCETTTVNNYVITTIKEETTLEPSSTDETEKIIKRRKPRKPTTRRKPKDEMANPGPCQEEGMGAVCTVCQKVYANAELLRHHMYTHNKPHLCTTCGKTFSQIQAYKNHKNSHSGVRPYPCRICTKHFADLSNRNKHEKAIHFHRDSNKSQTSLQCYVCEKKFKSQLHLRRHHRQHLNSTGNKDNCTF
ncbi:uncharacterized protein LOC142240288 [Haematobia irritans]|uniref:uncharacterized protein LOC142240288 n=1 Tax=Haematobia irritans TaxID=7368 RepID=UPI003F5076EF